jgi:hypothetical protein
MPTTRASLAASKAPHQSVGFLPTSHHFACFLVSQTSRWLRAYSISPSSIFQGRPFTPWIFRLFPIHSSPDTIDTPLSLVTTFLSTSLQFLFLFHIDSTFLHTLEALTRCRENRKVATGPCSVVNPYKASQNQPHCYPAIFSFLLHHTSIRPPRRCLYLRTLSLHLQIQNLISLYEPTCLSLPHFIHLCFPPCPK